MSVRVAIARMVAAVRGPAARWPMRFHHCRNAASWAALGAAWTTVSNRSAGVTGLVASRMSESAVIGSRPNG